MAKADLTKSHIAETFKKLAAQQHLRRISVRDIIQASDINRNTFYYHFSDKMDLVVWIFRSEFGEVMLENFQEEILICNTEVIGEKYVDFPFYIDTRSETNNLDLGEFWTLMGAYFLGQVNYYNHVLCSEDCDSLGDYLFKIYFKQLRKDILYAIGNKTPPENEITFLAGYFTNACVNYIINAMKHIDPYQMEHPSNLDKYSNISHSLIKHVCSKI